MLNTIEQAEARAAAMRERWTGDTVLTPRGAALAAVYRLQRALDALDPADLDEFGPLVMSLTVELARRRCGVGPETA